MRLPIFISMLLIEKVWLIKKLLDWRRLKLLDISTHHPVYLRRSSCVRALFKAFVLKSAVVWSCHKILLLSACKYMNCYRSAGCRTKHKENRVLRKLYFLFFSYWMGYDRGDSFPIDVEPNGVPFGLKSKGKLSPRSYPLQYENK